MFVAVPGKAQLYAGSRISAGSCKEYIIYKMEIIICDVIPIDCSKIRTVPVAAAKTSNSVAHIIIYIDILYQVGVALPENEMGLQRS